VPNSINGKRRIAITAAQSAASNGMARKWQRVSGGGGGNIGVWRHEQQWQRREQTAARLSAAAKAYKHAIGMAAARRGGRQRRMRDCIDDDIDDDE
jgi:hypothetical protein